ncbi:MAG: adenylyltransferase/cytidyltransferase family protein [Planctomycetes bacterium]|nr:adenylyltransferase/cytidyltransferase family protein [Planctomycetota bacterium]
MNGKIKDLDELAAILERARATGKKVVHCHGVFDLVHLGHIRHFQEARKLGDVLVVTVTADRHVNKGPHRPVFKEALRAEAIAALECVDYVAVNRWAMAVETIQMLKPHFYVKGGEFKQAWKDRTKGIVLEAEAVRAAGGELILTRDNLCSSSELINRHLPVFKRDVSEYLAGFAARHPCDEVIRHVERARPLKVLAVGEAVIDEYCYCTAIGKSSKEPALAVKKLSAERFAGGALALANDLAGFSDSVRLVTLLGEQRSREDFIRSRLAANVEPAFLLRKGSPTIVKRRFLERYFFSKLLEVYEINEEPLGEGEEEEMRAALLERLEGCDAVVVKDLGHGMLTEKTVRTIAERARYLAIHVQANAANLGYHGISRYPRADLVMLAENEIKLEARSRHGDLREMARRVAERLSCRRVAVTRGKSGCLCYDREEGFFEVPALATRVVDRLGGGSAFLALAALCSAAGAPMEVAAFVGNAAAAQAIAAVGHRRHIEKVRLYRQVESLLK